MAFEEVEFPDKLALGSSGGPGHRTQIVRTDSGHEERISSWAIPLRQYDASYAIRDMADFDELREFVIGVGGAAVGFRFKDYDDFTTAANGRAAPAITDVEIGIGDNVETEFQLIKEYVTGTTTRTRNLQKIVASSVLVEVNGVAQTEGVDFSVNYNTGLVTFNTAPGTGLSVKAGCEFRVPVRFGEGIDQVYAPVREGFDVATLQSIDLVEIRDGLELVEAQHLGGAGKLSTSIDLSVTTQDGRVLDITPLAGAVTVRLPSPAALPAGGPYFVIRNPATSGFAFNVEDAAAVGIATHNPGDTFTYYVGVSGAGANEWRVL